MRRVVYAPRAWAYIKGRIDPSTNQPFIYDISDYIVSGRVDRRTGQVSSAEIQLRNPNRIFTQLGNPAFLPMDPITIFLQRHIDKPARVFTGFVDESPYYQMYPGTCTIKASCTLKKLQYTFWDPALPFVMDLLKKIGWGVDLSNGLLVHPSTLQGGPIIKGAPSKVNFTDGDFGTLLYTILNLVGRWDDEHIWIENLPKDLPAWITTLFKDFANENEAIKKELDNLLSTIIGTGGIASGGGSPGGLGGGTVSANVPASGALQVAASQECSDLGNNSGGGCGSHNTPGTLDWGWSELMNCSSLGGLPCDTELYISANGRTVKAPKVDCGGGSSFNPVIGLYPGVAKALGLWQGSCLTGSYTVTIWRVDGQPLSLHSGSGHPVSGPGGIKKDTGGGSKPKLARLATVRAGGSNTTGLKMGATATVASAGGGAAGSGNSNAPFFPLKAGTYVSNWSQDQGVDIATNGGGCGGAAPLLAIGDGTVVGHGISGFGNDAPILKLDSPIKGHQYVYYGHAGNSGNSPGCQNVAIGTHVAAGQVIGCVGCGQIGISSGPHLEIGFSDANGTPTPGSSGDMLATLQAAKAGQPVPGGGSTSGGGASTSGSGGTSVDDMFKIAKGTAFATELQWPTIAETIEAVALQGHKSLMNDKPLLSFVQQVAGATLRDFQSAPNGDFYAFYPDYFGEFHHRPPYWWIDDVEVIDAEILLTDAPLVTHMYVVGDTLPASYPTEGISLVEKILSSGTVDIFDFFGANTRTDNKQPLVDKAPLGWGKMGGTTHTELQAKYTDTVTLRNEEGAIRFLQRYGPRPVELDEPLIRSQYFEAFFALQQFMLAWSSQFLTSVEFTFMPELYPGGKLAFPQHNLQMYINSVTHEFDYEQGFTTTCELMAPASMTAGDNTDPITWGMVNAGGIQE